MDSVAVLRSANAPFLNPGWVFHPRLLSTLQKLKDTTDRYLQEAGLLTFSATGGGGTLLGFPFVTTTQRRRRHHSRSQPVRRPHSSPATGRRRGSVSSKISRSRRAPRRPTRRTPGDLGQRIPEHADAVPCVSSHDIGLRRPNLFHSSPETAGRDRVPPDSRPERAVHVLPRGAFVGRDPDGEGVIL